MRCLPVAVVVLSSCAYRDGDSIQLDAEGVGRLSFGLTIARRAGVACITSRLRVDDETSDAPTRAIVAAAGLLGRWSVVDPSPANTRGEAIAMRDLLGPACVYLVTSSLHMRRARRVFERVGMQIIPQPTGAKTLHPMAFVHECVAWIKYRYHGWA